jgi:hypothetical protein
MWREGFSGKRERKSTASNSQYFEKVKIKTFNAHSENRTQQNVLKGKHRVSDPYSFFPDPDPDPEVEAGDQYGSGSGSNPDPGL